MRIRLSRRAAGVVGTGVAVTMLLAACGADAIEGQGGGDASPGGDSGGEAAGGEIDCSVYEEFGDLSGVRVGV